MLSAKNISFEYGNTQVLNGTSFDVSDAEKIALVGPNGVGKSTLLKVLGKVIKPLSGKVSAPNDLTVGYMPQEIDAYKHMTGSEFLGEITGVSKALEELKIITELYAKEQSAENLAGYESAYEKVESLQAYTLYERMGKPLSRVGLDESVLNKRIVDLSGGQKTKLALAAILLSTFDVFLLDEPTNNLDMSGLSILEDFIKKSNSAFVIVSHDRWFIKNTCKKIAELLPSGQIKLYSLGYDEYVESRMRERESAVQAYENYTEEKKRLEASAREKTANARSAANNSRSSDNDKIGSNARKEKAAAAHSKAAAAINTRLEQMKPIELPAKEIDLNFRFSESNAKMPVFAVRVHDAEIVFGNLKLGPYNLDVESGQKVVIIGPNGGGKSSFIKLVAGEINPASGHIEVPNGINLSYLDQDFSFRHENKTVLENICGDNIISTSEYYSLLARFGIKKEKADSLPSELSPGQRARALLAGVVATDTNLLLMDEPTNHLDIAASDELQNALNAYNGTLIVVTHDRELIDALDHKKIIVISDGKIISGEEASKYMKEVKIS